MRLKDSSSVLSRNLAILAVVLVLAPGTLAAPKYKVLHSFNCPTDGCGIWGALTMDATGGLYGAGQGGGPDGRGTIFELTRGSGGRVDI
jgi:hypothetical protein